VAHLTEMQKKRSLECLRLAADCRNLAWTVGTPGKTKSFLEMADFWAASADPTSEIPPGE
jgi:hypothetical protein